MVAAFSETGVFRPDDWRQIGQHLHLRLKGQLSAAEFFSGWNGKSGKKPSWEKLAHVLEKMKGYEQAARIAKKKERKNTKLKSLHTIEVPMNSQTQ